MPCVYYKKSQKIFPFSILDDQYINTKKENNGELYRYGPLKEFKFRPIEMVKFFFKNIQNLNPSFYFLCALYFVENDSDHTDHNDYQLGITGKAKKKENFIDAISREVQEELGLIVSIDQVQDNLERMSDNFYVSWCSLNSTTRMTTKHLQVSPNYNIHDTNKKVGCFVVGDFQEIAKYMCQDKIYKNFDGLAGGNGYESSGIVAVNIGWALEHLSQILTQWERDRVFF